MKKIILAALLLIALGAYAWWNSVSSSKIIALSPFPSTPTPTTQSTSTNSPTPVVATTAGTYKDGTYTGSTADAFYGPLQVQILIQGGRLTDVTFLQYPSDQAHSQEVSSYALPILRSEAIAAQSAQVNTVSGATQSSGAFVQSLSSALTQAS